MRDVRHCDPRSRASWTASSGPRPTACCLCLWTLRRRAKRWLTIQPADMTSRDAVRSFPAPPLLLLCTFALSSAGSRAWSSSFCPLHPAQPMSCPRRSRRPRRPASQTSMNGQTSLQSCLSVTFRMLRAHNRIKGVIAGERHRSAPRRGRRYQSMIATSRCARGQGYQRRPRRVYPVNA